MKTHWISVSIAPVKKIGSYAILTGIQWIYTEYQRLSLILQEERFLKQLKFLPPKYLYRSHFFKGLALDPLSQIESVKKLKYP